MERSSSSIGSVRALLGALLAAVICSGTVFAQASGEQTDIVVNGVALSGWASAA